MTNFMRTLGIILMVCSIIHIIASAATVNILGVISGVLMWNWSRRILRKVKEGYFE